MGGCPQSEQCPQAASETCHGFDYMPNCSCSPQARFLVTLKGAMLTLLNMSRTRFNNQESELGGRGQPLPDTHLYCVSQALNLYQSLNYCHHYLYLRALTFLMGGRGKHLPALIVCFLPCPSHPCTSVCYAQAKKMTSILQ